ncbi:hypothetical protein KHC23_21865 [Ancylobacter dichloromethanicus]|uniref:Oxidoreductase n=2 Tax=Ancylobacter dichloromethanicus TaxID=518825 RepID=A0A9W6MX02_9HYPH|nr:hypothetical protein [Ancylobacter dichloromethanicus]GLK70044.1 oxidoreductase [Ancylobacter dichloromethanicus]
MRLAKLACLALSLWMACLGAARAAGPLDLTLRWLSSEGKVLDERSLSLADLDRLAQTQIDTTTPWTQGAQRFAGPSFAVLAGLARVPTVEARVVALNDYAATIPAEDWQMNGVILATRLNGETMRVRDKGPYWVMYPIDQGALFGRQDYQSRMVWQVKSIDFLAR